MASHLLYLPGSSESALEPPEGLESSRVCRHVAMSNVRLSRASILFFVMLKFHFWAPQTQKYQFRVGSKCKCECQREFVCVLRQCFRRIKVSFLHQLELFCFMFPSFSSVPLGAPQKDSLASQKQRGKFRSRDRDWQEIERENSIATESATAITIALVIVFVSPV